MNLIPLLQVPLKKSSDCDFQSQISSFIQRKFEESFDEYQVEIEEFHGLRRNITQISGQNLLKSRDLLFKYYGQLEFLALRFPFGENGLNLDFEW